MGNSNLLFESIFKRKLSEPGTSEFLSKITSEYPYFSPAQFFLLLQTEKGSEAYDSLAAKNAVLFNNVYWLQFQLQEINRESSELKDQMIANADSFIYVNNQEPLAAQTVSGVLVENKAENRAEVRDEQVSAPAHADIPADEPTLTLLPSETGRQENEEKGNDALIDNTGLLKGERMEETMKKGIPEAPVRETSIAGQPGNPDGIIAERENSPAAVKVDDLSQPAEEVSPGIHESTLLFPAIIPAEESASATIIETVVDENEVATISTGEGTPDETVDIQYAGHFNNDSTPLVNEPETEEDTGREPEIQPMNFKLNIDTATTTEKDIIFEPLHTSDYFASLGIKLSDEIKPSDKLGKQLKSFTEWLKTMKKVHSEVLPPLSGQADMTVQQLAEQSNKEDTVATEAMADVLMQQGKAAKAIEVYKKLSLLNPSKSTYFAAKIDQLKEH